MHACMNGWTHVRMDDSARNGMDECMNGWMHVCMHAWLVVLVVHRTQFPCKQK